MNELLLEETIDKIINELNELKKRNNINMIEIYIHKHHEEDYYVTKFKVDYNIGE